MDKVEIDSPSLGKKWLFPCGRWLDKSKDDGMLERELYPVDNGEETYIPRKLGHICSEMSCKLQRFSRREIDASAIEVLAEILYFTLNVGLHNKLKLYIYVDQRSMLCNFYSNPVKKEADPVY